MRITTTFRTLRLACACALFALVAVPVTVSIIGCGSGSGKANVAGTAATVRNTAKGRATFTFLWPQRTTSGRLIPVDANSIQVQIIAGDGSTAATQLVARPASGANSATVTFNNLLVGTYTVIATAFPNTDGSGNAQAQAQTTASIVQDQMTPFTLTLASTITSLSLASSSTTLMTGQTVTLIPTAKDASGNIVLVSSSTLQWSSSASSVASVSASGVVSALSAGSATISVTETESGKTASTSFAVSSVASTSLPKATAFQLNASHTGSVSFGQPLVFPSSPTWSVNLGAAVSYPVIAGGMVFVSVANTPGYGANLYALDETSGRTVWGPIALGGTYWWAGLTYENGKIFVLNFDGLLRSYNATTGTAGWSAKMPGQYAFSTTPVTAGGVVYVVGAGDGGTVYAVDETNGNVKWTQSVENGDEGSPTIAFSASETATGIYGSYPCQLYDFNPASGASLWHDNGPCEGGGGATPVYANGLLYVRDQGGKTYNATNGSSVGTFTADQIPAVNATTGFFMASSTLRGVDLASGSVLWSFAGDGYLVSAPLAIDQTVIVASSKGTVYALDALTGAQTWSGNAGGTITSPDEGGGPQPLTGFGAGEGYLVVPAGSQLTAWHIAGQ